MRRVFLEAKTPMLELLQSPEAWAALLTLTAMEIVLGIDNVIFISILANKLPENQRDNARRLGLLLALVMRILLLFSISFIIRLTAPLDYADLAAALRRATLVLTDSGGIQEEAPSFGTPVLVLREVTERPEGVRAGVARLVGTGRDRILQAADELLSDETARRAMATARNPYGDGQAGRRIADIVVHHLTGRPRQTTDWEAE